MALGYLAGSEGVLILGGVTLHMTKFGYKESAEVQKSRAAGDRAYSRKPIALDWELTGEALLADSETPVDISDFRLAHVAFTADSDSTPKKRVAGAGLCTEANLDVDANGEVKVSFKVECDSADEADLPTVTVA